MRSELLPSIDWAGSKITEKAEFPWPAPERFTTFGIENVGYHDEVVLPIRAVLSEPGMPVTLHARVSLLTCSTVCVPQEFDLSLDLPRASGIDNDAARLISTYLSMLCSRRRVLLDCRIWAVMLISYFYSDLTIGNLCSWLENRDDLF